MPKLSVEVTVPPPTVWTWVLATTVLAVTTTVWDAPIVLVNMLVTVTFFVIVVEMNVVQRVLAGVRMQKLASDTVVLFVKVDGTVLTSSRLLIAWSSRACRVTVRVEAAIVVV